MFAAMGFDRRIADELAQIKELDSGGQIPDMLAETLEDPKDPKCKNKLAGQLLDVEVKQITTKGKGQPFNLHTFSPNAEVHERLRKELFEAA
jgi:hypothetical protein